MCNVSIIICTKNRSSDLKKCIDSITIQTYPIFELVIIDSGDDKLSYIGDYKNILNINYIQYKAGLTTARNKGIEKSNGDVIVFLDDDVILYKEYIYYIISIFDAFGNDVGGVCGNIINDDVRSKIFNGLIKRQSIKKIRNFILDIFFLSSCKDGRFQPSGFPRYAVKENISFVECMQGANMAFRMDVLKKFRFDEHLNGYSFMEDCDISYRVSRKYKIIYTPYARLIHNISPSARDSKTSRMKMLLENHYYLFNKNSPKRAFNKFAFLVSIFGLFFISFLCMQKDDIKGLISGLEYIIENDK